MVSMDNNGQIHIKRSAFNNFLQDITSENIRHIETWFQLKQEALKRVYETTKDETKNDLELKFVQFNCEFGAYPAQSL